MREKVILQDMTCLFVCPSSKWGTLERKALADSVYFQSIGGHPVLLCLEDSFLHREAEKEDIECRFLLEPKNKRFFDLRYYNKVKKIIREYSADFIHCYHAHFIWMLALAIRNKPHISLFLTYNKPYERAFKSYFHKWLVSRIDHVFCFGQSSKESLKYYLPINERKIVILGLGIDEAYYRKRKDRDNEEREIWHVGCYLPKDVDQVSYFKTLLNFVVPFYNSLSSAGVFPVKFKICLISDHDWSESYLHQSLMKRIHKRGIAEYIEIQCANYIIPLIQNCDIFIGLEKYELLNDFEALSILNHIPVCLPRTSVRSGFLGNQYKVGETYRLGDSRELKDKCLKLLKNYQAYRQSFERFMADFESTHCLENYAEQVYEHYQLAYAKRKRAYKRQKAS